MMSVSVRRGRWKEWCPRVSIGKNIRFGEQLIEQAKKKCLKQ